VRLGHRFWTHRAVDVKHFLITFPQKGQQERRATPRLIYCPDNLLGQRESVVYEPQYVCLVVLDLPGEKLCARSVQSRSAQ
jgi:hypothetical protein